MYRQFFWVGTFLTMFTLSPAFGQDGGRGEGHTNRLDRMGDRIDHRLDRSGDRIDNRLDHRGDRMDRRLDRRGDRIDRRMDHKGGGLFGITSTNSIDRPTRLSQILLSTD